MIIAKRLEDKRASIIDGGTWGKLEYKQRDGWIKARFSLDAMHPDMIGLQRFGFAMDRVNNEYRNYW